MYAYAQESNLFLLVVEPFMSWLSVRCLTSILHYLTLSVKGSEPEWSNPLRYDFHEGKN